MKRGFHITLASVFLIIGFIFITNSVTTITGLTIAENVDKTPSALTGLYFLFSGIFILSITKNRKKGQAAMEFLLTYGWAILAAIIAIGVLAYFGVFNPERLAGSSAILNVPLNINSFSIVNDETATNNCGNIGVSADCISLDFLQNSGSTITLTYAAINLTKGVSGHVICTNRTAIPATAGWDSGTSKTVKFGCNINFNGNGATNLFNKGSSIAGNINIKFLPSGSTLTKSSTGSIKGIAQ